MIRSGETTQDAAAEVAVAAAEVLESLKDDMEAALVALRLAHRRIRFLEAESAELRYALEAARRVQ